MVRYNIDLGGLWWSDIFAWPEVCSKALVSDKSRYEFHIIYSTFLLLIHRHSSPITAVLEDDLRHHAIGGLVDCTPA